MSVSFSFVFISHLEHSLVAFLSRTGPFNKPSWFNSIDAIQGNSAKWHSKYSRHHTKVFGWVACRVTSKITGSGAAERGWADAKHLKSGKRSHLSSEKVLKQCTLYTASNINRARIMRQELERSDCLQKQACWGVEDEEFDLGLTKWGIDVQELKAPVGPRRVFMAWSEDWENVMDNGAVMRTKLLNKYGGLVFDDIDEQPPVRMRVSSTKLKWVKRQGWFAMAEPPGYVGDGTDDELLEPFAITNDVLIELIKKTKQPEVLNVRMVEEGDEEMKEGSDGDDDED